MNYTHKSAQIKIPEGDNHQAKQLISDIFDYVRMPQQILIKDGYVFLDWMGMKDEPLILEEQLKWEGFIKRVASIDEIGSFSPEKAVIEAVKHLQEYRLYPGRYIVRNVDTFRKWFDIKNLFLRTFGGIPIEEAGELDENTLIVAGSAMIGGALQTCACAVRVIILQNSRE